MCIRDRSVAIAEGIQHNSTAIGMQYFWKSLNQILPGAGFYRGGKPGTSVLGVQVPFLEEPTVLRPWADLANNYGNLCQRVFSFVNKNCNSKILIKI